MYTKPVSDIIQRHGRSQHSYADDTQLYMTMDHSNNNWRDGLARIQLCVSEYTAKVLVACLVTPALWLNLSDSTNILIIHFVLLLKERTLDSIGHDLWKTYNVICLLWMIRYISLLTNIFT